jgi:ubiquinone/menaquinone biosynthesis C-methylase UbiE
VNRPTAAAYSATGGAWEAGPARIYDRLAEVVVSCSRVALDGARGLDLGAGTGAASRALLAARAGTVVAVDAALGMLAHEASSRPPAVVADALALPFEADSFDVTVAAFSFNHLVDPAAGLREAARVTRLGGAVIAASYAADDTHPVKAAVEDTLSAHGWRPEPWYTELRTEAAPKLATVDAARRAASDAGLDADVTALRVPFADLGAEALVAWRMGLAQHAPFLNRCGSDRERAETFAEAMARLGTDWSPLERSIIVIAAARRA